MGGSGLAARLGKCQAIGDIPVVRMVVEAEHHDVEGAGLEALAGQEALDGCADKSRLICPDHKHLVRVYAMADLNA